MTRLVAAITAWVAASIALAQAPLAPAPPVDDPKRAALATAHGSLSIRVVQGTPGEPAIGALPIEIDLRHRGMILDTIKTQSDEHGVVILESIPVAMPVQPVVRVKFENLDYQVGGGVMDAEHPHQDIEVVCFASTESPPVWRVPMRHMMVTPEPEGLRVTEVLVVQNPEQRTWIGQTGLGPKRVTTAFPLPSGAKDVSLGRGFHEWCCSTLTGGRLVNHLPLMPESTEMMYSYLVPAKDGVATLDITAPAAVDNLMLVLPSTLEAGALQGLEYSGEQAMGDASVRVYMAAGMAAGQKASISIGGFAATGAGEPPAQAVTTKVVAAVGGGLLVLVAAVLLIRRPGSSGNSAANAA